MNISENELNQLSEKLLSFLREELGDAKINFDTQPKKLEGGNETAIFHFELNGVQSIHNYFGSQFLVMNFLPGEKLPLIFGPDTNSGSI